MTVLELVAVPISVLGIWLTARRILWCWPVNFLACALYAKVFWDAQLYANVGLQCLFALFVGYGWWQWLRGQSDTGDIHIVPLGRNTALIGLAAAAMGAGLLGWLFSRYSDAALPWPDAILTSFSLLAQIWTARRHVATWLLWIVVDIFYVAMFISAELWLTAGLYAVLILLAINGYRSWRAVERSTQP